MNRENNEPKKDFKLISVLSLVLLSLFYISSCSSSNKNKSKLPYEYTFNGSGTMYFLYDDGTYYPEEFQVIFSRNNELRVVTDIYLTDFYKFGMYGDNVVLKEFEGPNAKIHQLDITFLNKNTIKLSCDIETKYDYISGNRTKKNNIILNYSDKPYLGRGFN